MSYNCSICKKLIELPIKHTFHGGMCYEMICDSCHNKMKIKNKKIAHHVSNILFIFSMSVIFFVFYLFGLPLLVFIELSIISLIGIIYCLIKLIECNDEEIN